MFFFFILTLKTDEFCLRRTKTYQDYYKGKHKSKFYMKPKHFLEPNTESKLKRFTTNTDMFKTYTQKNILEIYTG